MKKVLTILILTLAVYGVADIQAQDWPQYMGPARDGISTQQNILRSWSEEGPEVLWSVNIGIGFGGPVIKDGKAYLLDRDNTVGDKMRCFDLSTGRELWSYGFGSPGETSFPGSRSVPAIDGNYIYSCGHSGDLYCIDINTQKPVWTANVWKDFGGERLPTWAISQCPLIYGHLLIIASQAPQAGVVAYDKLTGKVVWTTPSLGPVGYVSPAVVKVGNQDHIVMITAATGRGANATGGRVVGIEPNSGAILWDYSGWNCVIPIPSAVDAGEGRILITGGYHAGSVMIKAEKKADGGYQVTELYRNAEFGVHTQPPILYNGHFYAQCSTNETKNGLMCMSIDGETRWKTGRSPIFERGSIILADGLLISTDGLTSLYLVEANPSAFKPLASAAVLKEKGVQGANENQNWAPIALSDGKLLIRNQNRLICVRIAN
ncbi:MAG: PQQ-binding-like beta-propeller repeat protein [Bacteroidales bacterium]